MSVEAQQLNINEVAVFGVPVIEGLAEGTTAVVTLDLTAKPKSFDCYSIPENLKLDVKKGDADSKFQLEFKKDVKSGDIQCQVKFSEAVAETTSKVTIKLGEEEATTTDGVKFKVTDETLFKSGAVKAGDKKFTVSGTANSRSAGATLIVVGTNPKVSTLTVDATKKCTATVDGDKKDAVLVVVDEESTAVQFAVAPVALDKKFSIECEEGAVKYAVTKDKIPTFLTISGGKPKEETPTPDALADGEVSEIIPFTFYTTVSSASTFAGVAVVATLASALALFF